MAELRGIGSRSSDAAVHKARRRVKKVRALLLLVHSRGPAARRTLKRLRLANWLLGPVANGEAIVGTVDRLGRRYPVQLAGPIVAAIRKGVETRRLIADKRASSRHVLDTVTRLLAAELARLDGWTLRRHGYRAIAHGLERTALRADRAMRRTRTQPTIAHYRSWRRRVKDQWLQLRLIDRRCGGGLGSRRRDLEALDGSLGEHHNCALLERMLLRDMILNRSATARVLRVVRRYRARLRRDASRLAVRVYSETPWEFVGRAEYLWRAARDGAANTQMASSRPRAA